MISIIICSRKSDISQELKKNIAETIGVEHELIIIDNSQSQYSIFSAYNEGVHRAKYEILCFAHEDILFHTSEWGQRVLVHLADPNIGLIGVIGGHYLPDCSAAWWSARSSSGQLLQGFLGKEKKYTTKKVFWNTNHTDKNIVEVAAVDGLWFCIPKKLFQEICFDEITFKGFHCYDTDICLQIIRQSKKVCVVFDISIEHFSGGQMNEFFLAARELLYEKWKNRLPILQGVEMSKREQEERTILVKEINQLLKENLYLQKDTVNVRNSKAYRLGKLLLRPLCYVKKIIANKK